MPLYTYEAFGPSGELVEGIVEAITAIKGRRKLTVRGYLVLRVVCKGNAKDSATCDFLGSTRKWTRWGQGGGDAW